MVRFLARGTAGDGVALDAASPELAPSELGVDILLCEVVAATRSCCCQGSNGGVSQDISRDGF